MGERLPNWKFLLIWCVFFLFGLSALIQAIRWWWFLHNFTYSNEKTTNYLMDDLLRELKHRMTWC